MRPETTTLGTSPVQYSYDQYENYNPNFDDTAIWNNQNTNVTLANPANIIYPATAGSTMAGSTMAYNPAASPDAKQYYTSQSKYLDALTGSLNDPFRQGVQTASMIGQGLGSLANIYFGFQNLGIAKDQLDISKEQWAMTKDEINRIKDVRKKLSSSYMA